MCHTTLCSSRYYDLLQRFCLYTIWSEIQVRNFHCLRYLVDQFVRVFNVIIITIRGVATGWIGVDHSCSVRTVRTLRLGKSSGTLWNFITAMELYGTILRSLHFAGDGKWIPLTQTATPEVFRWRPKKTAMLTCTCNQSAGVSLMQSLYSLYWPSIKQSVIKLE